MKNWLLVILLLSARPVLADRVLGSIWLDTSGQATHAGKRYRLLDAHGRPYRLPGPVALTITAEELPGIVPLPLVATIRKSRIVPHAPLPVQLPITGQALGADGRQYQISGTVTLTVGELPLPQPQPGGVVVEMVIDAGGSSITQAPGGTLVGIRGAGFGAGGIVKIAGQAAAVLDWNPTSILAKLPVLDAAVSGPIVVAPTGVTAGQSAFAFTVLSGPAPNPIPGPTPNPTPGTEWPAGSGVHWQQDRDGYYQPLGGYPWWLPGHSGVDYPVGHFPPWARLTPPPPAAKRRGHE